MAVATIPSPPEPPATSPLPSPHFPASPTLPASPSLPTSSSTPAPAACISRRRSSPLRRPVPAGTTLLRLTFAGGARGAEPAVALFSPSTPSAASTAATDDVKESAPLSPCRRTRVAVRVASRVAGFSGAVTTTVGGDRGVTTTVVELPPPLPLTALAGSRGPSDAPVRHDSSATTLAAVAAPAWVDIVTAVALWEVDIAFDVYTAAAAKETASQTVAAAAAANSTGCADWVHVGTATLDGDTAADASATRVLVLPLRARGGYASRVPPFRTGSLTLEALTCTALPANIAAALAAAPPRAVQAAAGSPRPLPPTSAAASDAGVSAGVFPLIGHRGGGSGDAAGAGVPIRENTVLSMAAVTAGGGVAGVELDVQLSADGVPLIYHDFWVDGGRPVGGIAAADWASVAPTTAMPLGLAADVAAVNRNCGDLEEETADSAVSPVDPPIPVDDGRYGGGGGAAPFWGSALPTLKADHVGFPLAGRLDEDLTDEEEAAGNRPQSPPSPLSREPVADRCNADTPTLNDLLAANASRLTSPATSVVSSTRAAAAAATAGVPPPAVLVPHPAAVVATAVAHSTSAPNLLGRRGVVDDGCTVVPSPTTRHHPFAAFPGGILAPLPSLADVTRGLPPATTLYVELKVPPPALARLLPAAAVDRNALLDATLGVLANAPGAATRRVVLMSFDAHIAVLAGIKQTAYPVYLLNAERREALVDVNDERTRSVEAAAAAAAAAGLDGLVVRSDLVLEAPGGEARVAAVAAAGLALLTYGQENGGAEGVLAQRALGVGGCICDGAAAVARGVAAANVGGAGGCPT